MPSKTDELRIPVRSHRGDFEFERRIYYIPLEPGHGRVIRLNPAGVPVRGVAYGALAAALMLALSRMPLLSALIGLLPAPVAFVVLPGLVATLLTFIRPGGRPFHVAVRTLCSHALSPRALYAFRRAQPLERRWRPPAIVMLASGAEARCRRLRFTGPGRIWIRRAHTQRRHRGWRRPRAPHLTVTESSRVAASGTGLRRSIRRGKRVEIRPAA